MLLLPHLEEEKLYREYRQDEPWDSPHNIKLLDRMPKVYRHPGAKNTPPGYTHYRAFVSPRGAHPQAAFADGQDGPSWATFAAEDGTANTILAVEANEAVPWTKPDELVYDPLRPLPKLGVHPERGYNALFADGSTRFFRSGTPETQLRAWITRNGGEPDPSDR